MRSNTSGTVSLALVLVAAASLVSMISTLKIDSIVHGDLYRFGLEFSYRWAIPYWTMTTVVFAMGWFNIITAIAFQFYVLIYGRKEAFRTEAPIIIEPQPQPVKEEVTEVEAKPTEKAEEYKETETKPIEEAKEKPEETQTVVEATSSLEQSETTEAEKTQAEEPKEQAPQTPEESKTETTKTTTTPQEEEIEQEKEEKREETPILVGIPEEESETTTSDTPQQV